MSLSAVPVEVAFRIHDWAARPALRVGSVVMRDEQYHRHSGTRRYFWLVDEGVQLVYEPFGWRNEWYIGLVDIEVRGDLLQVTDRYVDNVVEGMGPTYRMLDLDELAQAVWPTPSTPPWPPGF